MVGRGMPEARACSPLITSPKLKLTPSPAALPVALPAQILINSLRCRRDCLFWPAGFLCALFHPVPGTETARAGAERDRGSGAGDAGMGGPWGDMGTIWGCDPRASPGVTPQQVL